jgi:hypothetical protein
MEWKTVNMLSQQSPATDTGWPTHDMNSLDLYEQQKMDVRFWNLQYCGYLYTKFLDNCSRIRNVLGSDLNTETVYPEILIVFLSLSRHISG